MITNELRHKVPRRARRRRHVLPLCNSTTLPSTDTTLAKLLSGVALRYTVDLVPEKRIEG